MFIVDLLEIGKTQVPVRSYLPTAYPDSRLYVGRARGDAAFVLPPPLGGVVTPPWQT